MLNKTDVALLALDELGSTYHTVDVTTGTQTHEKIIKRKLDMSLLTILQYHAWKNFTAYAALTLVQNNPTENWAREYSLPTDVAVVRRINSGPAFPKETEYEDQKYRWQEVYSGGLNHIYTDIGDANIEYTKNPGVNVGFPTHFGRAWAAQLAEDIAPAIITNNFGKVKRELLARLNRMKSDAVAVDMGNSPMKVEPDSIFVRVRSE